MLGEEKRADCALGHADLKRSSANILFLTKSRRFAFEPESVEGSPRRRSSEQSGERFSKIFKQEEGSKTLVGSAQKPHSLLSSTQDKEVFSFSESKEGKATELDDGLPKQATADFTELKRILIDYLFGGLDESEQYALSQLEQAMLKFLLNRKLLFTLRADRIKRVESLRLEEVVPFLLKNPPRRRNQLLKRTVFMKVWKFNEKILNRNLVQECFGGDCYQDYKLELVLRQGNISQTYFNRVFQSERLQRIFLDTLDKPQFWAYCNKKHFGLFCQSLDGWLRELRGLLKVHSPQEEKKVLMKMRFLPYKENKAELIELFELNKKGCIY